MAMEVDARGDAAAAVDADEVALHAREKHLGASPSRMTPYLVCPEFFPVLTRLLMRSGLSLSALVAETAAAEPELESSSSAVKLALEECLQSDNEAERYVAEALLTHESTAGQSADRRWEASGRAGEPPVGVKLEGLRHDALRRLVIPGAVILGVDAQLIRRGPNDIAVIVASDLVGKNQDGQHEQQKLVDIVICEVAYGQHLEATTSVLSAQHGSEVPSTCEDVPKTSATQVVRACRVEVVQAPRAPFDNVDGDAVAEASDWAEALCRRCASPTFVAPAFHTQLAQLLLEIGATPASLSARSAGARGHLTAKLVALARRLQESSQQANAAELAAKANLCLAAASASSAVMIGGVGCPAFGTEDVAGAPLLLLKGRDAVPEGSFVAGGTVERELGHGVTVSFGACGLRPLLLTRRRMPHSRISAALPSQGTSIACLLLRPEVQESGLIDSAVAALAGSSCAAMEDLLARQVGLSVLAVPVPDGRPSRAKACRHLAEACGSSLRVEIAPDGLKARITGAPSEVEAAARAVASLAGQSIPVPERLAWRIVGRRGMGVRQLEQDSGGTWIRVDSDRSPPAVEIFGESSAVDRAKALIEERHAYDSLEIPSDAVARVIGRGGSGIRDIEASSGGASIFVDAEKCFVEVMGEAPAVQRAMAELRERSAPARRMEVPRHVVPYLIGRNGSNKRDLETASGAVLWVDTEAEACFVEIRGYRSSIDKAVLLLEKFLRQHAHGSFEAPRDLASHISGHGGALLREVQASTGASVRIGCFQDHCLVEAFGEQAAVDAALQVLKRRTVVSRRQISIPRPSLSYVVGRAGAGAQDIQVVTGASLHVDLGGGCGSEMCTIEARGDDKQIDAAEAMLRDRSESSTVKVPSNRVSWIIGRGGATIRELQASTSAVIYVPADHDATCEVQVYGSSEARSMACEKITALVSDARVEPRSNSHVTCNGARQRSRSPSSVSSAALALAAAGPAEKYGGSVCTSRPRTAGAIAERPIFAPQAKMLPPAHLGQIPNGTGIEAGVVAPSLWTCTTSLRYGHPPSKGIVDPAAEAITEEEAKVEPKEEAKVEPKEEADVEPKEAAKVKPMKGSNQQASAEDKESMDESREEVKEAAEEEAIKKESLLLGKKLPESLLKVPKNAVTAGLPWHCKLPVNLSSPPKSMEQKSVAEVQAADAPLASHTGAGESLLLGKDMPKKLLMHSNSKVPWAWKWPFGVGSPPKKDQQATLSLENPKADLPRTADAPSDAGGVASPLVEATPPLTAPAETPPSPLPNLLWVRNAPAPPKDLSAGTADSPSLCARHHVEGADTSHATPEMGVQPFPWSWSLPITLDNSTPVVHRKPAQMPEGESLDAPAGAAVRNHSERPVALQAQASCSTELCERSPEAAPSSPSTLGKRALPLFPAASPDSAFWEALPTPVRAIAPLPAAQPSAKRARRGHSPESEDLAATSLKPKLFVLDGMNILKSSNSISWGTDGKDQDLEWDQLERACRYYTSRGHEVSVYLPPLRAGHEEQLERCCREFGNIFVSCRSASDDQFMINTVKLYEDEHRRQDLEGQLHDQQGAEPCCCIVTNDRFQDWKLRGDVDSAWVERHCVRFAFGPGGFVPSRLM